MRPHRNHRAYIGQPFEPKCPLEGFSEAERAILNEYGAWMQAMHNVEVEPVTEAQRHFFEVCADLVEPETVFERVWVKYVESINLNGVGDEK
jgi:uncharacterized protein YifE (UPF0438 family)